MLKGGGFIIVYINNRPWGLYRKASYMGAKFKNLSHPIPKPCGRCCSNHCHDQRMAGKPGIMDSLAFASMVVRWAISDRDSSIDF